LLAAAALGLALKYSAGGGAATPGAEKSVAVLPFTNLSGDKDDEYFSAGMTEDMVTQLAQLSGLRVVSHSAPGEKLRADRELAKKLGVENLLQGSVRREEKRFRISAQLIDAETGKHLWAKSYDRDIKDMLVTQSEVATEIAEALRAVLLKSEKEALARHAQGNVELHLLYRQGIHMLAQGRSRTPDVFKRTKAQFERILELDANSALGHAGLAAYHLRTPAYGLANMEQSLTAAKRHADRALELDPKSSEGWLVRGLIESERGWDWKASEAAFKKSIELNPANAYAWRNYAHRSLLPAGRIDLALAASQRAFAADPLNAYISHGLSIILGFMGRCDEAIARSTTNIENNPGYLLDHVVVGRCREHQGRFREATAAFAKLNLGWFPEEARRDIDAATDRRGEQGYWEARVKWAKAWAAKEPNGHYFVAAYQAMAGRADDAFAALNRALDERDIYLYTLKVDPYFEGLRGDPRFAALLKRLNLE
jgi:TolB-like protein/Flp pilus assembly protein TadD